MRRSFLYNMLLNCIYFYINLLNIYKNYSIIDTHSFYIIVRKSF